MGTTGNAMFSGNSRYAQDFQTIISRAVSIASLPITQLNNQKTQLTNESTALSSLDAKFQALTGAVQGVENALGGSSFQATVSDSAKLSVTLGAGASEGTYSVNILNAGAYATSLSTNTWDSGGTHTWQLSIGGTTHDLAPTDSTAASVASAINSAYGDQVHATVVNVGTGSAPDYRLSLQAAQLGDLQPDILRDSSSVQTQKVTGALASYIVNDSGVTVNSNSRSIPVATGVTLTLQAGASGAANVIVTRSATAASNALSSLADAYNAAADALKAQRGQAGGALAGDPVVQSLSDALRSIGTYGGTGSIDGLRTLGLDLDTDGHLTFDASTFQTVFNQNSGGVAEFFGSSATGGFLKAATDRLNTAADPATGLLSSAEADVKSQITDTTNSIADQQTRVNDMQDQLNQQMAAADAAIAKMEQQYNYITQMFQAMQTNAQQYK